MLDFHAQLLHGPEEAALLTRARTIAASVLCVGEEKPCGSCVHCRKTLADIHPDVITLRGEQDKPLSIAAVRELQSDVLLRPNEGARKVYLLPRADSIDERVQNALLKLLEDGPHYAVFLLLAQNPKALLETVRSRCQTVSVSGEQAQVAQEHVLQAQELIRLLEAEQPLALLEKTITLEKCKREELIPLLEALMQQLAQGALAGKDKHLAWYEQIKRMRSAMEFHLAPAHLAGWLATMNQEKE